jgi:hypothetical protein
MGPAIHLWAPGPNRSGVIPEHLPRRVPGTAVCHDGFVACPVKLGIRGARTSSAVETVALVWATTPHPR